MDYWPRMQRTQAEVDALYARLARQRVRFIVKRIVQKGGR